MNLLKFVGKSGSEREGKLGKKEKEGEKEEKPTPSAWETSAMEYFKGFFSMEYWNSFLAHQGYTWKEKKD